MEKDKEKEKSALSFSANCDSHGAEVKLEIDDPSVAKVVVVTTGCVVATGIVAAAYIYVQKKKQS